MPAVVSGKADISWVNQHPSGGRTLDSRRAFELPRATADSSVVNVTLWDPDEAHRRA